MPIDLSDSYHFHVMRRAIDAIDAQETPLQLDQLAAQMGMSPAHFQRLFSQWVGVSPKRYQQYLTLDHARRLLADRFTVLDTALATNLSGTGRLHDLFLRWEAMSPGDYALGGAGLTIFWGWFESPFGPALVMGTEKGICGIGFAAETQDVLENARTKLAAKRLHMIVANDVSAADAGFAVATNRVTFLTADGALETLPLLSKEDVAIRIIERVAQALDPQRIADGGDHA